LHKETERQREYSVRLETRKCQRQEESSFCELATAKGPRRKEAKKLHPLAPGSVAHRVSYEKSFFASFFQKKKTLPACHLPDFFRVFKRTG
jgi:hypothetical protein